MPLVLPRESRPFGAIVLAQKQTFPDSHCFPFHLAVCHSGLTLFAVAHPVTIIDRQARTRLPLPKNTLALRTSVHRARNVFGIDGRVRGRDTLRLPDPRHRAK